MTDSATLPEKTKPQRIAQQFLEPFNRLRGEFDRMVDEFPSRWPSLQLPTRLMGEFPLPAVEMTETPKAYKISVEVPGIEPDAIDLQVEGERLIIRGEKREEREEEEENYTISERSYGSFERRVLLPQDALPDEISAKTKNGVLNITVPRDQEAVPERRKIEIKSATKD